MAKKTHPRRTSKSVLPPAVETPGMGLKKTVKLTDLERAEEPQGSPAVDEVIDPHALLMLREAVNCGDEPSNTKMVQMAARKLRKF